jgi:hypothetical protein
MHFGLKRLAHWESGTDWHRCLKIRVKMELVKPCHRQPWRRHQATGYCCRCYGKLSKTKGAVSGILAMLAGKLIDAPCATAGCVLMSKAIGLVEHGLECLVVHSQAARQGQEGQNHGGSMGLILVSCVEMGCWCNAYGCIGGCTGYRVGQAQNCLTCVPLTNAGIYVICRPQGYIVAAVNTSTLSSNELSLFSQYSQTPHNNNDVYAVWQIWATIRVAAGRAALF